MDLRGFVYPLLIFAVAVAVASVPGLAFAQQNLPTTDVEDTPVNDVGSRQATRPPQTFNNDVLNFDQRPELDQALDTLPGVQARIEGSPTLSLRGSGSSARTLVLENGVPLNFADGVGFNPLYLATENTGSVTFLKGPSSSLFGHDALTGVVEFFGAYGSSGQTETFAGAPLGRFQITAYESHTDNNFTYQVPRLGVSGTRNRDDSETTRFTLYGQSSSQGTFKWRTFNLLTRQIGSTPVSLESPSISASAFNNWGEINSLELQDSWGEITGGTRTSYKYLWQNYSGSAPAATMSVRENLSALWKFTDGNFEIFDDYTYENFQASYLPQQAYYPLNEYGASSYLALSDTLSVQGALRFSTETAGLSPSVGLISIQGSTKYFMNYSEGYRPPSITELYAQYQGFIGNTALSSEHSQELDLGFEKTYGDITTHFEAFSRNFFNLIDNVVLVAGTFTPENVGDAYAYGFELNAETKGPLQAGVSLTYLYSEELDTQKPMPLSPAFQGSLHLGKTWDHFSCMGQLTYWSPYDDVSITSGQLVTLSSWTTLDLFASYEFTSDIFLRLAALDIFDTPKELNIGYPSPQRSFTLSVMGYL